MLILPVLNRPVEIKDEKNYSVKSKENDRDITSFRQKCKSTMCDPRESPVSKEKRGNNLLAILITLQKKYCK